MILQKQFLSLLASCLEPHTSSFDILILLAAPFMKQIRIPPGNGRVELSRKHFTSVFPIVLNGYVINDVLALVCLHMTNASAGDGE